MMKKIIVEKELFVEKCKKCPKKITGPTEPMVRSRMRNHMLTHEVKE